MYDKLLITVITDGEEEHQKYFKLLTHLLKGKILKMKYISRACLALIEGEDFIIRFVKKDGSIRGMRHHFVFNMTQDKEFDDLCVKPQSHIYSYLKDDPKWSKLFGGEKDE